MLPYFDAHCDTISALMTAGGSFAANKLHLDLARLESYAPRAQVFALFGDVGADNGKEGAQAARLYRSLLRTFRRAMEENRDSVLHCRTGGEQARAEREGKLAAWLSVEGAELLQGLTPEEAYRDGVRIITLTWNYPNALGGSCVSGGGLTEKGRDFVHRCGELGIVVDVSHGSDALFYDVAALSDKPFIASHSNARALRAHRRNLTDDQFRVLIEKGGVAGVNLYAEFLTAGRCSLADVLRHVEHFLSLGGAKHIALGGDLDGCDRLPEGISGVQDVSRIAEEMARLGYTDDLIHDIFYRNLRRVLCGAAG